MTDHTEGPPDVDDVDAYTAAYTPRRIPPNHWEIIAPFVRTAYLDCRSRLPYPKRRVLAAIAAHTYWCWQSAGIELKRELVFDRRVISDGIRNAFPGKSPSTQANARAVLLRAAEALNPDPFGPRLPPLAKSAASVPYLPAEQAQLRGWANFQRSESRRRDARALLSLGFGAGLPAKDLLLVRTDDIAFDAEGALVHVSGPRARAVPVLRQWEDLLDEATAASAPGQYLFRPEAKRGETSLVGEFALRTKNLTIQLSAPRMRATWIVTMLAGGVPARTLLDASGVASFDTFSRYIQFVPPENEHAVRFSLRNAELNGPG
ncbi:hypothetical protein ASE14_09650 [Agromyces sp. Root81]|uniref:hypothetical protein n=1 Tax=Agromyces sp. Root81 TaxID=1736601 RepID=UPI0006FC8952|nr:hypothetical protein [Agromyces sp. Root81]KRC61183.1 hypothetical protein ASE14_09650 [Agromyces sp. Root81]